MDRWVVLIEGKGLLQRSENEKTARVSLDSGFFFFFKQMVAVCWYLLLLPVKHRKKNRARGKHWSWARDRCSLRAREPKLKSVNWRRPRFHTVSRARYPFKFDSKISGSGTLCFQFLKSPYKQNNIQHTSLQRHSLDFRQFTSLTHRFTLNNA